VGAPTPARLLEQETEYRAVFEASSDGLVINDADTGVVLEANPAFCRMHGYDGMVGLHPTMFIHPNSQHLFDVYLRAVREGREFRVRAQDVRRDGTVFDVEVLGRGFLYQGRPALLGVVRDVTEHVRAYQDLEARVAERTREIERRREVAEGLRELLAVVNSKRPLDEILGDVLAQAGRLLGSEAEGLYLLDERDPTVLRLHAGRDLPPGGAPPTVRIGTPTMGLAAEQRRPVVAPDLPRLLAEPFAATVDEQVVDRSAYLELVRRGSASVGEPLRQQGNRQIAERFRSEVAVPLLARGICYGALVLTYRARHVPSDDELELISAFAGQAGLAIENARLREREEQRTREIDRRRQVAEGLRDLLATINSTRTLDEILAEALAQAGRLLGSDASAIYVPPKPGGERLRVAASSGLDVEYLAAGAVVGAPVTGLAFARRRPVAVCDVDDALSHERDAAQESRLEDRTSHLRATSVRCELGERGGAGAHGAFAGHRAVLAVPLAAKDVAYGCLTLLYRQPRGRRAERDLHPGRGTLANRKHDERCASGQRHADRARHLRPHAYAV